MSENKPSQYTDRDNGKHYLILCDRELDGPERVIAARTCSNPVRIADTDGWPTFVVQLPDGWSAQSD
jgi:hypothetical protein